MSWLRDLCKEVKSKCSCWCQCILCPRDVHIEEEEKNEEMYRKLLKELIHRHSAPQLKVPEENDHTPSEKSESPLLHPSERSDGPSSPGKKT